MFVFIPNAEAHSEPSQTSKIEHFAKIVYGFEPLTFLSESSISDRNQTHLVSINLCVGQQWKTIHHNKQLSSSLAKKQHHNQQWHNNTIIIVHKKKQSQCKQRLRTQNFPKNLQFLPPNTHTYCAYQGVMLVFRKILRTVLNEWSLI